MAARVRGRGDNRNRTLRQQSRERGNISQCGRMSAAQAYLIPLPLHLENAHKPLPGTVQSWPAKSEIVLTGPLLASQKGI